MEYPDFKTWLKQKKIDPKAFASKEMERFMELKKLFDQVNPNSFIAQKLFLIWIQYNCNIDLNGKNIQARLGQC